MLVMSCVECECGRNKFIVPTPSYLYHIVFATRTVARDRSITDIIIEPEIRLISAFSSSSRNNNNKLPVFESEFYFICDIYGTRAADTSTSGVVLGTERIDGKCLLSCYPQRQLAAYLRLRTSIFVIFSIIHGKFRSGETSHLHRTGRDSDGRHVS